MTCCQEPGGGSAITHCFVFEGNLFLSEYGVILIYFTLCRTKQHGPCGPWTVRCTPISAVSSHRSAKNCMRIQDNLSSGFTALMCYHRAEPTDTLQLLVIHHIVAFQCIVVSTVVPPPRPALEFFFSSCSRMLMMR